MKAMREGPNHIQWNAQMLSIQAMLDSIDAIITMQPNSWKEGMRKYWEGNMQRLLESEPPFDQ